MADDEVATRGAGLAVLAVFVQDNSTQASLLCLVAAGDLSERWDFVAWERHAKPSLTCHYKPGVGHDISGVERYLEPRRASGPTCRPVNGQFFVRHAAFNVSDVSFVYISHDGRDFCGYGNGFVVWEGGNVGWGSKGDYFVVY